MNGPIDAALCNSRWTASFSYLHIYVHASPHSTQVMLLRRFYTGKISFNEILELFFMKQCYSSIKCRPVFWQKEVIYMLVCHTNWWSMCAIEPMRSIRLGVQKGSGMSPHTLAAHVWLMASWLPISSSAVQHTPASGGPVYINWNDLLHHLKRTSSIIPIDFGNQLLTRTFSLPNI